MQSDTLRQYCVLMAKYNQTANKTLFEVCDELPENELYADKSAFFISIHKTLNHVIVGDDIWMSRFKKEELPYNRLDIVPYETFEALQAGRFKRDAQFIQFFEKEADDAFFEGDFTFTSTMGDTFSKPVMQILAHFFNHQTHHRGQVHTLLTQSGVKTPVSDLPYLV